MGADSGPAELRVDRAEIGLTGLPPGLRAALFFHTIPKVRPWHCGHYSNATGLAPRLIVDRTAGQKGDLHFCSVGRFRTRKRRHQKGTRDGRNRKNSTMHSHRTCPRTPRGPSRTSPSVNLQPSRPGRPVSVRVRRSRHRDSTEVACLHGRARPPAGAIRGLTSFPQLHLSGSAFPAIDRRPDV